MSLCCDCCSMFVSSIGESESISLSCLLSVEVVVNIDLIWRLLPELNSANQVRVFLRTTFLNARLFRYLQSFTTFYCTLKTPSARDRDSSSRRLDLLCFFILCLNASTLRSRFYTIMAAPSHATAANTTGKYILNRTLSTPHDDVLAAQGVTWLNRTLISIATVFTSSLNWLTILGHAWTSTYLSTRSQNRNDQIPKYCYWRH